MWDRIQGVRNEELSTLWRSFIVAALFGFTLNTIPVLVSVLTFGAYVLLGNTLTAAEAFTSLSLFTVCAHACLIYIHPTYLHLAYIYYIHPVAVCLCILLIVHCSTAHPLLHAIICVLKPVHGGARMHVSCTPLKVRLILLILPALAQSMVHVHAYLYPA